MKCNNKVIKSAIFKVKINKYDVTMVYLIPIIIHFRLSNQCKIFRKCSWRVILLISEKKLIFFRKTSQSTTLNSLLITNFLYF